MTHDGDFKLSATLHGHEEDVRAIVFPSQDTLYSASRDSTIRQWKLTSSTPPTYDDTIVLQGSHWLNSLDFTTASKGHEKGLLAAGGKETFVFVKAAGRPTEEDPHRLLIGHAGNISCVAFSEDGSKIISGGWDSQAFVWDVEEGHVTAELQGHQGPLWGILVYDEKFVLTACADKKIRLFDLNGKLLQTITGHSDVVRCFCKLPEDHSSGADFASAGNDEVIRLWTLEGASKGVLDGHTAYIYSLAVLPNGDIVSSSEDRTVRVWRDGQSIQTITHPAISLWSVAACPETGDIVSGASDNVIRIFSRDPKRQADSETIKAFEELNRMYAIPAETASQGQPFEKENLPGPEVLKTKMGDRDGQQLFVSENDGSITAHLWSASTAQWNLIGTVVSGEGSGSAKKTYQGKEYDYVFDIDIEDGKPPLKLPYNSSESSWDAARKFLEKNELPMSYYEQVANWITQNTKGTSIGQVQPSEQSAENPGADAWGTNKRYRPGDIDPSQRKIPHREFAKVLEGNAQNAVNKLLESSVQLQEAKSIQPDATLTENDSKFLHDLVGSLDKSPNEPQPSPDQLKILLKLASQWPSKSRVPAVALLARLAVSANFISNTSSGNSSILDGLISAELLSLHQATPNNAVHAIRLLANLFSSASGRQFALAHIDPVLTAVRPFATTPESPAQFRALATLYLNYAVLLTTAASNGSADTERATALLIDLATMLECDLPPTSDQEAFYRTLLALGTLLHLSPRFKAEMKGGLAGTLHVASSKSTTQDPRSAELIQEIRSDLR